MDQFELEGEFITIAQLLKALDYIGSGGETKYFLFEHVVLLNDIEIYEKKKKIKKGDVVTINNKKILIK
ncbi:MAG: RNA-binding S4 domain-containing protein [Acholeplasma sp.]